MVKLNTNEELMLFLINLLAEKYPQSAILKGGMALRLLDCPRFTNDLDYTFVPYNSKKDVTEDICKFLDKQTDLQYKYSLNSKCLRIIIAHKNLSVQLEINVAQECPAVAISTASLAIKAGQLSRVIQIMDYPVAMAHKLAAWNERVLVRDLYDLNFYYTFLQIFPDLTALQERLKKVASTKRNKNPKAMSLQQLLAKLRSSLSTLGSNDIAELADYLPPENLAGLEARLKANLLKFCDEFSRKIPK